jgi:pilus assembly protein FimV
LTRNVEALKKLAGAANPASASSAAGTSVLATAPAASAAKPELLEQMLASPLVLPLTGLLLAGLGAIGFMQWRSRREIAKTQAIFVIDGADAHSSANLAEKVLVSEKDEKLALALGPLDAGGSIDPIDEAAAYLDHARDVQAEEVLKEALRSDPERLALRLKLLEVHAQRHDIKAFEELAQQVKSLTKPEDWAKVQELGLQIDADNLLYLPAVALAATVAEAAAESSDAAVKTSESIELDLDLGAATLPLAMDATQVLMTGVENVLPEIDLDLSVPASGSSEPSNSGGPDLDDEAAVSFEPGVPLMFDLSTIDLNLTSPEPQAQPASQALDLGAPLEYAAAAGNPVAAQASVVEPQAVQVADPLKARFELAIEFRQIGDIEGAISLLQEVIAQGNGELREKAAALLQELS